MKIEEAIKQPKFRDEHIKAHINVIYTAAWFGHRTACLLKPYGITWQQFNILRILRGLHPEPATVKLLTERMIDKMSNASRLVDKLKKKGLVERSECPEDRRRVDVSITQAGLDLINRATQSIDGRLTEDMSSISDVEARLLNDILDKLREGKE